jgi:hypothetical protein
VKPEPKCSECGCVLVFQDEKEHQMCKTCIGGVPEYDDQWTRVSDFVDPDEDRTWENERGSPF